MAITTIQISLKIKELIIDIRTKSHLEVSHIADAKQRYALEAGLDKQEDINRCLYDSYNILKGKLTDFNTDSSSGGNNSDLPNVNWTGSETLGFSIKLPARKNPSNLGKTLSMLLHEYIVDMTLSLYYAGTQEQVYSQKHEVLSETRLSEIKRILYRKNKPTYQ